MPGTSRCRRPRLGVAAIRRGRPVSGARGGTRRGAPPPPHGWTLTSPREGSVPPSLRASPGHASMAAHPPWPPTPFGTPASSSSSDSRHTTSPPSLSATGGGGVDGGSSDGGSASEPAGTHCRLAGGASGACMVALRGGTGKRAAEQPRRGGTSDRRPAPHQRVTRRRGRRRTRKTLRVSTLRSSACPTAAAWRTTARGGVTRATRGNGNGNGSTKARFRVGRTDRHHLP